MDIPPVGTITFIKLSDHRARYIKIVRRNSDSRDYRRCAACGDVFGFGPIAEDLVTHNLVCPWNCTKPQ